MKQVKWAEYKNWYYNTVASGVWMMNETEPAQVEDKKQTDKSGEYYTVRQGRTVAFVPAEFITDKQS